MADLKKLASLLVEAVNEADDLADATAISIHRIRLRAIRDDLDKVLRRVQAIERQAVEADERERSGE